MNDTIAMNMANFKEKITTTKKFTKVNLKEKLETGKLELIKKYLDNNEIKYNASISSIEELKQELKNTLPESIYNMVLDNVKEIETKIETLCNDLLKGSTNSFTKFVNTSLNSIIKPITKATTFSLASRTALILAPTITSKLAVGAALTGRSIYKIVKSKKYKTIINEKYETDRILQELEITKDNNNNIINTRFNQEIQNKIINYFNEHKISFNNTGYLSLREKIYSLDVKEKQELCRIINEALGRGINLDERINKYKNSPFEFIKKFGKNVGTGVAGGIGMATAINSVDPALLAGPLNGVIAGTTTTEIVKNSGISEYLGEKAVNAIGAIGSTLGTSATFITEWIPGIGETFENINALENIVALGIGGIGVGAGLSLISSASRNIIKIIKNTKEKFNTYKNKNEILELDNKLYGKDNLLEYQTMQNLLSTKEITTEEKFIIEIITEYINELGIKIEKPPQNIQDLTIALQKLDDTQRKKITTFTKKIQELNKEDSRKFLNSIKKAGKFVYTCTLLGLSGLSIYDILNAGEFLPKLGEALFHDIPNNVFIKREKLEPVDEIFSTWNKQAPMIQNSNPYKGKVERVPTEELGVSKEMQDLYHSLEEMTIVTKDTVKVGKTLDSEKITEIINGLDTKELIELTNYHGRSLDVKGYNYRYSSIGKILEQKLPEMNDYIKNNNLDIDVNSIFSFQNKQPILLQNPDPYKGHVKRVPTEELGISEKIQKLYKNLEQTNIVPKEITLSESITMDEEGISNIVKKLDIEKLIELTNYYGKSNDVTGYTKEHIAIGKALEERLPEMIEYIKKYNLNIDILNFTKKATDLIANANVPLSTLTEVSTDTKKSR